MFGRSPRSGDIPEHRLSRGIGREELARRRGTIPVVADQPHARVYNGLPPIVHGRLRPWLIVSAVLFILVAAALVTLAVQPTPEWRYFGGGGRPGGGDLHSAYRYGLWMGGAFIIGGVLGFALVRGRWSMLALDAAGLAIGLWLMRRAVTTQDSIFILVDWFFWVVAVAAGARVRALITPPRLPPRVTP